jgi:hypothetical protein
MRMVDQRVRGCGPKEKVDVRSEHTQAVRTPSESDHLAAGPARRGTVQRLNPDSAATRLHLRACMDPQPSARDAAGAGGVAWANQGWIIGSG